MRTSQPPINNVVMQMDEIKDADDTRWHSCLCPQTRTDRSFIIYLCQMLFSLLILGFSAIMLKNADGNCEKSSGYFAMISFLMGKLLADVTNK